jgi:hypothetical protein
MTIAVLALTVSAPALADDWDFMLINSSGKEIKAIEVAPTGSGTWQPNKIDPEVQQAKNVAAGKRTTVHFDKAGGQCRYDIKATFVDDTNSVWTNVNVCDNAYVTVKYSPAGAPTFTAN